MIITNSSRKEITNNKMRSEALFIATVALTAYSASAQDDIDCWVPGTCADALILAVGGVGYANECLRFCEVSHTKVHIKKS